MTALVRSCASCDETGCAMHRPGFVWTSAAERTAWVLDDVWPETASMVGTLFGPRDQLLAPGVFSGLPARYNWPVQRSTAAAVRETVARHWSMRHVAAASGAVRQRSYLEHDRTIARALAKAIDYRARHLVVAQNWLPWLAETGALGGRSFDVVMSRYPFAEIHRLLDQAAEELGPSATIADFRADEALVDAEAELLSKARRIITPHHGIAALFPGRSELLTWHRPAAQVHTKGSRVAFLGPTIARQRPDIARDLASTLDQPLIVFGSVLESFWDGVSIEQRTMGPGWLNGLGAIIHPATMTNQPRELLEAVANGVRVYATETCGLDRGDYLPLGSFPGGTADHRPATRQLVSQGAAG
jgi:hypothetical protein